MARLIAFLAILFFVSAAHSAPSCPVIAQEMAPCLTFVKGTTDELSQACCNGAKDLSNNVHSNQDKKDICLCLKDALSKIGDYEPSRVSLVPKKCGLKLNLPPIDQNTDCSKFALMGY
ncbi:probable non-specific lipid-transfer protein 2 [Rosa rugosa]|uniref:probable non-specific lipid-transfer protein 2 n=1 Tax=Rosa rugosa TaxID=74645 RepID=UPI002B4012B6|nr:probable non-specific lipid-transfer protein 2 [Rosa rugosa]